MRLPRTTLIRGPTFRESAWVRGVAWSILGGSGPLDSGSNPDGPIIWEKRTGIRNQKSDFGSSPFMPGPCGLGPFLIGSELLTWFRKESASEGRRRRRGPRSLRRWRRRREWAHEEGGGTNRRSERQHARVGTHDPCSA